MSESYFATGYIRLLYRLLQMEQLSSDGLFNGTGYCLADLMRADFQMPFEAQMCFCQNAIALTPPGLGLRSGHQLQIAAHGSLGTAMQSAADLQAALATAAELLESRASFYSVNFERVGDIARVEFAIHDLPNDLVPFFTECILFTITNCLSFYSGKPNNLNQCFIAYDKPPYGSAYGEAFGGSVQFNCPQTAIHFDAKLLPLISTAADPVAYAENVQRCRGQISGRQNEGLVSTVENFLLENPGKLWTVEELGPLFAVSPRTLIRRLKNEGTSYQTLRDNVLKRQATIYLSGMTVEAAAISLGFADTSSFRRTFKRWFGMNPVEWRAKA